MRTIKHILDRKSRELAIIEPEKTVFEALKLMADKNIGSVIVMDGTRYLGILSERNYARQVVLLNKSSKQLPVREIMRTDLPKLSKNDPVEKCMEIMTQLNVRYLPVVENETLIGLISVKDLLDEVLLHQKDVIENLTHYINT
ncbi:CBS domain-containing protein [Cloacibacterium caeni]|uniref:CBS domain-containing protein n=1 Tax=Cloacibacterium caeni TaxID=2004710 RepID=UPI001BD0CF05|nr:CBS domain-containing protein [Cloacibacterium caeni]